MLPRVRHFLRDDTAGTAIEYGILASLLALGVTTASSQLGAKLSASFSAMGDALSGGTSTSAPPAMAPPPPPAMMSAPPS